MRRWFAALALWGLVAVAAGGSAAACPYCRIAAANMAADDAAAAQAGPQNGGEAAGECSCCREGQPCAAGPTWIITGGLDYTSSYYRRGYLQDDSGLILQPFLTGGCCLNPGAPVLVQPYVTSWNSFGLPDLDDPMATMVEGMGGVFLTWDRLSFDANYAVYDSSPVDPESWIQEAGFKASYDLGPDCPSLGAGHPFTLRPSVGLVWETFDESGAEDAYWELGLEPAWRLPCGCRRVAVALPLVAGFNADGYYFDSAGAEESLGYLAAGLAVSLALPQPTCGAHWYLSASVQYMRLVADNLVQINGGADAIVAKVGLGFSL
jgi:hypothetical protein